MSVDAGHTGVVIVGGEVVLEVITAGGWCRIVGLIMMLVRVGMEDAGVCV